MTSHLRIFFNTKIEDYTLVSRLADNCLTPFRYLFHGRDVRVIVTKQNTPEVVSCRSFYAQDPEFKQSPRHWMKAILAIIMLVPSLLIGTFIRVIAYKDGEVRKRHQLAKTHLTPVPWVIIGQPQSPYSTEEQVVTACQNIFDNDPLHRKIDTMVIFGQSLELSSYIPELISLRKLILVNGRIVPGEADNQLATTRKWYAKKSKNDPIETLLIQVAMRTTEEARKAERPKRSRLSLFKRFSVVYNVIE